MSNRIALTIEAENLPELVVALRDTALKLEIALNKDAPGKPVLTTVKAASPGKASDAEEAPTPDKRDELMTLATNAYRTKDGRELVNNLRTKFGVKKLQELTDEQVEEMLAELQKHEAA